MKHVKNTIKRLAKEINKLEYSDVPEWIEENILEVTSNYNELRYTIGGPSISIYIDSGVIIGETFSDSVIVKCNTHIFEEYFDEYKAIC